MEVKKQNQPYPQYLKEFYNKNKGLEDLRYSIRGLHIYPASNLWAYVAFSCVFFFVFA